MLDLEAAYKLLGPIYFFDYNSEVLNKKLSYPPTRLDFLQKLDHYLASSQDMYVFLKAARHFFSISLSKIL